MSKVYLMTWYRGVNYGSLLQAYALQRHIISEGHDCSLVDYRPAKFRQWARKVRNGSVTETLRYKKEELAVTTDRETAEAFRERNTLFDRFRKEYLTVTPICQNGKEITREAGEDAVYVCGSDQIWNPHFLDPCYMLSFSADKRKNIAYAPSIGVRQIPEDRKKEYKKYLAGIGSISVREPSAAADINALTGQAPEVTTDPVFLLSAKKWEEIADPQQGKYLFCYFLGKSRRYMNVVRKMSEETGLPVIMVPVNASDMKKSHVTKCCAGPAQWLGLVMNAEHVFTDSFHCLAFSLLFHKQFTVFRRFSPDSKKEQNSRVESLLELAGMKDRLIALEEEMPRIDIKKEEFEAADQKIGERAEFSKRWLREALLATEGA